MIKYVINVKKDFILMVLLFANHVLVLVLSAKQRKFVRPAPPDLN
jgi:hypothetical protein